MNTGTLNCSASTLRGADLPTRVAAAAEAGFAGIGLRVTDYLGADLTDGRPPHLAGLPAPAITTVQLCDVPPEPESDLAEEGRRRRQLPGRGAGDTLAVLKALRDNGMIAPVSVEMFSDELDARPPAE